MSKNILCNQSRHLDLNHSGHTQPIYRNYAPLDVHVCVWTRTCMFEYKSAASAHARTQACAVPARQTSGNPGASRDPILFGLNHEDVNGGGVVLVGSRLTLATPLSTYTDCVGPPSIAAPRTVFCLDPVTAHRWPRRGWRRIVDYLPRSNTEDWNWPILSFTPPTVSAKLRDSLIHPPPPPSTNGVYETERFSPTPSPPVHMTSRDPPPMVSIPWLRRWLRRWWRCQVTLLHPPNGIYIYLVTATMAAAMVAASGDPPSPPPTVSISIPWRRRWLRRWWRRCRRWLPPSKCARRVSGR